jgi:succinate-semialdehyde dehydrogenase/glutarate-semialdehyde dehydrogenase
MIFESRNPATEQVWSTSEELSEEALAARLDRAAAAFASWRRTGLKERTRLIGRAAQQLEHEKEALARLAVLEMGKTLRAARAEVEKCAWVCRHYAFEAARYLADDHVEIEGKRAFVRHLPLGPVLAVMPWNFPYWQVFRFIAPALTAGNVGLLKHASNVPRSALAIESVLLSAGFPEGVFQTLLIGAARVEKLLEDPRIRAVTLTGSEGAGAKVGATATRHLKKSVLELGGADAFVVMPSADLERAAKTAVVARTINNGQSCIAAKRFIVHEEVYERFVQLFVQGLLHLKVGDPMLDDTNVGPLVSASGLADLTAQVARAQAAGARLLCGGKRGPTPGYYYLPTALDRLPRSAPVWREEVFGPVAFVVEAHSLDEAIELANDSPFGLGSSVWTRDEHERARFVDELEAGCTFVDGMVVSDPRLPFGGVKRSGYGRELGRLGMLEFMNAKTVVIEEGASMLSDSE